MDQIPNRPLPHELTPFEPPPGFEPDEDLFRVEAEPGSAARIRARSQAPSEPFPRLPLPSWMLPPSQAELDAAAKLDEWVSRLENWFSYHKPELGQPERYERIRAAGLAFAKVLCAEAPPSDDLGVAVMKVREAVMLANAAIACGGR